jgi:hypothetical protein
MKMNFREVCCGDRRCAEVTLDFEEWWDIVLMVFNVPGYLYAQRVPKDRVK